MRRTKPPDSKDEGGFTVLGRLRSIHPDWFPQNGNNHKGYILDHACLTVLYDLELTLAQRFNKFASVVAFLIEAFPGFLHTLYQPVGEQCFESSYRCRLPGALGNDWPNHIPL
jgi:hypothetical protein